MPTASGLTRHAPGPGCRTWLACGLWLVACGLSTAGFYDVSQVHEVRLYFAQSNWDEILDSLYAAGEEGRLKGRAVIDGASFDSVGVRYKGYSSYNPGRKKNPLNVKLDEVFPGQQIEGHGTVRLANVYKDPSFVREALSYEIARMYMPAGRASFANVFVNDTLIGLYTNDEDPDPEFMRRFYYCSDNARFKARIKFDSVAMVGWKYLGPDSTPYLDYFELESDSGWPELIGLFDTLVNHNAALDNILNVDQHLWMLAFDILLVNLDAPVNTPQNHYLYRDASGRFCPNVWDLNENFGAFRELHGIGQLSLAQMQQLDPFLRSADTNYPVSSMVLNDARRRRMYVAHARTILEDVFSNNWYRTRAYELQDIIDASVQADRNKFYTYNDFLNNITRSVGSGPLAIVGITELMNQRTAYVLGRPEFQAAAPVVAELSGSPDPARPGTDVQFIARVADADSAWLGFRQNPAARFARTPLYDDGRHGDGAAGDGVYGAPIRVGAGNVDYYVYAENADAGVFYPASAEHNFCTLPVAGDVVINELMALNNSTVPDQNGEYDDWVELYNNSPQRVSLDGYFLASDSTRPAQWQFPDTAIAGNGYLCVWLDGDSTQAGLHASFALSAPGDVLIFTDPDGQRLDRVVFGPQDADVSFGRYPNGTGAFRQMNPTFARANDSAVGVEEPTLPQASSLELQAGPNPFQRSTTISYTLPAPGRVTLQVVDAAGRVRATISAADQAAGRHEVRFPAQSEALPAGVYFARLATRPVSGPAVTKTVKLTVTGR